MTPSSSADLITAGGPPVPVVDAHTHLFPEEVQRDRAPFLLRDSWFRALYESPKVKCVPPEQMIESMDVAGFYASIVCGWPWQDQALCRLHNDYHAEVARRYPGRLPWLGIVNPLQPSAVEEVRRAVELGAVGIGELNADAQGFDWRETEQLAPVADACIAFDVPLMVHASEPVGHDYLGKGTATPEKLLAFIAAFPELRIVAAHWGGGLPFYELMPEVAAQTRNVFYDSAASTYLYDFSVFPIVQKLVGEGKILFGTDYPLLSQQRFLRRVRESGLPLEDLSPLLAANAADVYGLDIPLGKPSEAVFS